MAFMVLITLLHNGFFSKNKGPDSNARLSLVGIYAVCFIIHACSLWFLCLRALTRSCANAAWGLLNRAHFAVVERKFLLEHIENIGKPLDFTEIEKSNVASTFEPIVYDAALVNRKPPAKIQRTRAETDAQRQVSHNQETLRDDIKTTAERSLDGVLVNVVTMLGVCATQAFSTWTAKPLTDNSSTQIGSIALLASVLLGISAMFRSVLHLSTTNKALDQKLYLKEVKINHQALNYVKHHLDRVDVVGFGHGYLKICRINPLTLFYTSGWAALPLAVILGPAFPLLPSAKESERHLSAIDFELHAQAMGQKVVFTTNRTSEHSTNSETSANVNSINVYCQFNNEQYDKAFSVKSQSD